jgi:hypothetical protein
MKWNASGLPRVISFYRLNAGKFRQLKNSFYSDKKVVLIRDNHNTIK